ncbi:MAG: YqcC family protein [Chromatiales bacterium]|nr:YqcC family protein [Chromatiales bacterium]
MAQNHQTISQLLLQLEQEMRLLSVWDEEPPAAEAFTSTMPFCYDKMAFNQWLQWVFIPKITEIISTRADFPGKCEIEPMAEVWCEQLNIEQPEAFLSTIRELDKQLSA